MRNSFILLFSVLFFFSCKKSTTNLPGTLPNSYSDQQVGASAKDFLSGSKYTTINVEVQYMPGYQLDATTVSNVTAYLNSVCNKTGGINITQTAIAANGNTLSLDSITYIERQDRQSYTSGSTLSIYVMITDGAYSTAGVLGVSYLNTSTCLFGKTIFNNSGSLGQVNRVALLSTVLEHELGHLMGLVNDGSPMVANHEDTVHANHCTNTHCLMYYATETDVVGAFMSSGNIPTLDSNCLKDLHANGGK